MPCLFVLGYIVTNGDGLLRPKLQLLGLHVPENNIEYDFENYIIFEEFEIYWKVNDPPTVSYVIAWLVIWIGFPLTVLAIFALHSLVCKEILIFSVSTSQHQQLTHDSKWKILGPQHETYVVYNKRLTSCTTSTFTLIFHCTLTWKWLGFGVKNTQ